MIAIICLVGIVAGCVAYGSWLRHSVRPRQIVTRLTEEQVRDLFVTKVARAGWKVVDDGDPMIAQSPLITGSRQQIALAVTARPDDLHLVIAPVRMRVKALSRVPTKAHTLRIRMNSFVTAVERCDSSARVLERTR